MTAFRHSFTHIQKLPPAFWVVIFATLINQLGNMAMVFLVPYLTIHFKLSLPHASIAYASCCGALLVSGLFAGVIADRFGAAKVMAIVISLNALVLLSIPLLNHFWSIEIMCLLWGGVFGLFRPAAQTFLSFVSPRGTYKVTFSIYRLANNLGMSIGPAIGGYLAMHSFPLIFYFNGTANICAALILFLGLTHKSWISHAPPVVQPQFKHSFQVLKQDATLRLFLLGMIPVSMVFYQHASTLSVFIHTSLHYPLSFYGLLFTLNTLMIVFFELPLNIATLHWSPRRTLMIGSFLIALGFGGYFMVTQTWHLFALTMIWTTGEMILFPAANSYVAELSPEDKRGNYMSLFTTSTNLGLLFGPWAGAMVMHHFSSTGLWLACAAWGILSVIIFQYLRPHNCDKLPA